MRRVLAGWEFPDLTRLVWEKFKRDSEIARKIIEAELSGTKRRKTQKPLKMPSLKRIK